MKGSVLPQLAAGSTEAALFSLVRGEQETEECCAKTWKEEIIGCRADARSAQLRLWSRSLKNRACGAPCRCVVCLGSLLRQRKIHPKGVQMGLVVCCRVQQAGLVESSQSKEQRTMCQLRITVPVGL